MPVYTKAMILRENKEYRERLQIAERDREQWKHAAELGTKDLIEAHKAFTTIASGRGTRIRTRRLINLGNFEHAFLEVEVESAGGDALASDSNRLVDLVDKWSALLRRRIDLTRQLEETNRRIDRLQRIASGRETSPWMVETSPSLDDLGQQAEEQLRQLRVIDAMWTGDGEPVDRAPVVQHTDKALEEE